MNNCYAKDYCKIYKTEKCNIDCGVYSLLRAVYTLSGIPNKYRYNISLYPEKADQGTFKALQDYMHSIEDNVSEGKGIYIWSETAGNGKTTWATKIANHYIRKQVAKGRLDYIVKYINIPAYLEEIRQSFNGDANNVNELNDQLRKADLVIFDDIGAETTNDWVRERLYTLINQRDNDLKSNIYTSNLNPEQLQKELGDRLYSRIITSSNVFHIIGGG